MMRLMWQNAWKWDGCLEMEKVDEMNDQLSLEELRPLHNMTIVVLLAVCDAHYR